VKYRVMISRGALRAGQVVGAEAAATGNLTMLVARGILQPVTDLPKTKRKPAEPVETADEPEEL